MSRTCNNKIPQEVAATIDLHGYRKSEGISSLTMFLDQVTRKHKQHNLIQKGDVWVLVITGSGAHSTEGPILRTAVQTVLDKRQMRYTLNKGRGSFTVKANSGIVFYEPALPMDTKVVVKEAPEFVPALPKRPKMPPSNLNPLPREVATNKFDDLEENTSSKHLQKTFQKQRNNDKLLKKAVSMSLIESNKEQEEEEKFMKRTLSLSMIDIAPPEYDDGELQKALELSQQEFERQDTDEELQRALELSQQQLIAYPDDDEDLQRALELSQKVCCVEDEELMRMLELSKQEREEQITYS